MLALPRVGRKFRGKVAGVRLVTWKAWLRIAGVLAILWAIGRFMCHCDGKRIAVFPAKISEKNLRAHVEAIAASEHNVDNPAPLARAAEHIQHQCRTHGSAGSRQR